MKSGGHDPTPRLRAAARASGCRQEHPPCCPRFASVAGGLRVSFVAYDVIFKTVDNEVDGWLACLVGGPQSPRLLGEQP